VERVFGDLTAKQIRRGVFRSVPELIAAIDAYITQRNTHPKPFVWTKTRTGDPGESKPGQDRPG
jgi:hypothetical protein